MAVNNHNNDKKSFTMDNTTSCASMARKLFTLLAFACLSIQGWATAADTYLPCDGELSAYANTYKWYAMDGATSPQEVVGIQAPAWSGLVESGIYVNVGQVYDGVKFDGTAVTVEDYCYIQGTGGLLYISKFTAKCTTVEFTNGGTVVCGLRIQNDNGTGDACSTSSSGGEDPEPAPTTVPANDESRELCQVLGVLGTTKYSAPGITRYETAGWGGSTHETVTIGGKSVKHVMTGTGAAMGCGDVDVRGMTHVQFDIWCAEATTFGLQLVCWNSGWQYGTKKTFTTTAEEWKTVTFALSEFEQSSDNFKTMVLMYFQDLDNTPFYITNIYYYTNSVICASEPEIAPYEPSQKACQVYSLYSDYNYTGQFAQLNNALWCGGSAEDVYIAGKKIKKLSGSSGCYGFEKNGWNTEGLIDVSDYDYLHVDVWVPQTTTLELRPIIRNATDNGNDEEKWVRRDITSLGTWQSINIPVSEFTSQGVNLERLYQFKFEGLSGGKKLWFTNLFFYKSDDCTPDYETWNLAQGKPTYAGKEVSGFEASKANNGNINDRWATGEWPDISTQWWYVDLGANYDLTSIEILFDNAYPTSYVLQVATENPAVDESKWTTIYTNTSDPGHSNVAADAETNKNVYNVSGHVARWVRIKSSENSLGGQYGFSIWEFRVFGTEAATLTKAVSATPSDPAMGSATVTQNGVDKTEVETGSTVTFSAVANEGYIFVNWSNGETRETFDATVDAAMHLTANFRALGNVYCNTAVTSNRDDDVHTAFVTFKRTSANNYKLIVRSEETLGNFTNTELVINGTVTNLNNQGTLSNENHVLTYEFTSSTAPSMNTPYLYLNVPGSRFTECWFTKLTNIEFGVDCNDDVSVSSVSLPASAAVAIGATTSLTATVSPAYATNQSVTWSSDNTAVATVSNAGVVTGVAAGTAHITATSIDGGRTAQCTVTVTEAQIYWGNGRDADQNVAIVYSIEYNNNKTLTVEFEVLHTKGGFEPEIYIENAYKSPADLGDNKYSYTTTATYESGDILSGSYFWLKYSDGVSRINIVYTVGSTSERQAYIPTTLAQNMDDAAWAEWIAANDGQTRDVAIARPMPADGQFKTICFPFSMTAAQVAETFSDCEILRLSEAHMKSENEMYIQYAPVSTIEAGYPYLITLNGDDQSGLDFKGVTINSATTNNTISKDAGDGKAIEMIGTFTQASRSAQNEYYLDVADNMLHSIGLYCTNNSRESLTIPAFRCYFRLTGFANPNSVCARIVRHKDVATDIEQNTVQSVATKQILNGTLFIIRDGVRYTVTGVKVE